MKRLIYTLFILSIITVCLSGCAQEDGTDGIQVVSTIFPFMILPTKSAETECHPACCYLPEKNRILMSQLPKT